MNTHEAMELEFQYDSSLRGRSYFNLTGQARDEALKTSKSLEGYSEYSRKIGRRNLITTANKNQNGMLIFPWNTTTPSSIEETARFAGWIKAVILPNNAPLMYSLVKKFTTVNGMNSPRTVLNPLMLFRACPQAASLTRQEYLGYCRWFGIVRTLTGWRVSVPSRRAAGILGRLSVSAIVSGLTEKSQITDGGMVLGINKLVDLEKIHKLQGRPNLQLRAAKERWENIPARLVDACNWSEVPAYRYFYRDLPNDFGWSPRSKGASPKELNKLLGMIAGRVRWEIALPIVTLIRVFGNAATALSWVRKTQNGVVNYNTIHDAGQIPLPDDNFPIDRKWGMLFLHAPSTVRFAGLIRQIEQNGIPTTREEMEVAVSSLPVVDRLGVLCKTYGGDVSRHEDFFRTAVNKQYEAVPAPKQLVVGQYKLRQLAANDPLQVMVGLATDCCQHLGAAGRSCAVAAWEQPGAAIWAVEKAGRMVAQAFVWRSKDDKLVLDSVEALAGHQREEVAELFATAALSAVGRLGIRSVSVGITSYGMTTMMKKFQLGKDKKKPECIFKLGYSDANAGVYRITEKISAVQRSEDLPKASQSQTACNELSNDSGVFCEHCDAEVHPDAEICPACGMNIAEWV